jgi:hypothetical protein
MTRVIDPTNPNLQPNEPIATAPSVIQNEHRAKRISELDTQFAKTEEHLKQVAKDAHEKFKTKQLPASNHP